jgi:hypothetical protein
MVQDVIWESTRRGTVASLEPRVQRSQQAGRKAWPG